MDLTKDKEFMKKLSLDVESLSKTLYLENPDLWFDFLEKSEDKNFDEMSLFFAAKHNLVSIIKYAIEVNNFDLSLESKNKTFTSIKNHILNTAISENSSDVINYLSDNAIESIDSNNNKESNSNHFDTIEYTGPLFNCPHCNVNIFEFGYNVLISSTCTYSSKDFKIIRSNPKELDKVICSNCNKEIDNITPSSLERITNIENCITCGIHLPTAGMLKEISVNFNKEANIFKDDKTIYCCKSCRKPLENDQLQHFNLI